MERTPVRPTGTLLGPGGRAPEGLRPVALVLALVAVGANTVLMLADRAPGLLSRVGRRLDATAPRTAARVASEARDHGSDTLVHILVWAVPALLLTLAAWSWGSALLANAGLFAYSLVVELAQPLLSVTRELQPADMAANLAGVTLGVATAAGLVVGRRLFRPR